MKLTRIVLLPCLLCFHSLSVTAAEDLVGEFFATINQRLSYMEDVALFKRQNQTAVEDLARERVVIDNAKEAAASLGLKPQSVEAFFEAQIAVAKAIQHRHRADWLSAPPTGEVVNLDTEIRPLLTELGDQIIFLLTQTLLLQGEIDESSRSRLVELITTTHVSLRDKNLLFDALRSVRLR
jgi:chorismate mutase